MHKKTFKMHPFFRQLGDKRMLSAIGQRFRPIFFNSGQYLHRQGDDIDTLKVVTKGIGAFVIPSQENQIFAVINPVMKGKHNQDLIGSDKLLYHCGFEDTVMSHLVLLKDINNNEDHSKRLIKKANFSKRLFTVQCIHNMETLVLTFQDIDVIK